MAGPPEVIKPSEFGREASLPPLGLLLAGSLSLDDLIAVKQREQVPVQVVFPVATPREADNLAVLLATLKPFQDRLIDQVWIAFGGTHPGKLRQVAEAFAGVRIFKAQECLPPDQQQAPLGKGAVMRAFVHHLIVAEQVTHPRAVVQFIDADIRPAYFKPQWVVDPVGAILWFRAVEAAKVVYHRPRGGRLNAMLRSLMALCPHPGVQALKKLVYLLSGEIAGTLNFWTSLAFQSGYGVETMILLSFALDYLQLQPGTPDLAHLVQVYMGEMDHRHAPLTSTPLKKGLDQMAGNVFKTLEEVLSQAGIFKWQPGPLTRPSLSIPLPGLGDKAAPKWLEVPLGDQTLPPLKSCPEVRAALSRRGK